VTNVNLKLISADQVRANLKLEDLIEPIRNAFKSYSRGDSSDAIGFLRPNGGEVHIKSGFMAGSRVFAVKVSAGFQENIARGNPVWDGVVMAFDASTGAPMAIVQDGGLLTDWRTAVAGAVASHALARGDAKTLGVIGTGIQGLWQPLAHKTVIDFDRLLIWGRSLEKAKMLQAQLEPQLPGVKIKVITDLEQLVRESEIIVTATGSLEPIIKSEWVQPGTHITAVGADDDRKRELELSLLERANVIVVDSLLVNQKYGDIAQALKVGTLEASSLIELGTLLTNPSLGRSSSEQITVAKLVGLGVQDLAAVEVVLERCE
jgi:ornithine cyclodeaminase/alanine dehydrogenase-like protein (mu-crystallin family)